ncbi:MAG TPA: Gfo/Idh/MocA family oxidoreductase [Polyangiaceae bacterium]|nr:Gfo/Idh/MocA family oxidoreductase [Polyangiaceae bacterium]
MIRLGVVGAGQVAELASAAFARRPDVELVGIADPARERAEALARKFGAPAARSSLEELLEVTALDAVYIASPNVFHAPQAIRALESGKHVLLEKPFALSWEEARQVVDVAERVGRTLTLSMNQRHADDTRALRAWVASGALGTPHHVRARWLRRSGIPRLGSWFGRKSWAGGGVLMDVGVHLLDLAFHLLDDFQPLTVSGQLRSVLGPRGLGGGGWGRSEQLGGVFDVEDFACVWLRFAGGASLALEVAWATHQEEAERHDLEIVGSLGAASSQPARWSRPDAEGLYTTSQLDVPEGTNNPYDHFIEHLHGRAPLVVTTAQALAVQRVLDAVYESAAAGREIALSWP